MRILSWITKVPHNVLQKLNELPAFKRHSFLWSLIFKEVKVTPKKSDLVSISLSKPPKPLEIDPILNDTNEYEEIRHSKVFEVLDAYIPDFTGLDKLYDGTKRYLLLRDNKRKDPFYWKEHPPIGHFKAAKNIIEKIIEKDSFTLKEIYAIIGFIYYGVYNSLTKKQKR